MDGRAIAYTGEKVPFTDGSGAQSTVNFHTAPDGAGVFQANDGGFYYASNSEGGSGTGGVGVIKFNANGQVSGYYRTLTGTTRNCGGGRTPW